MDDIKDYKEKFKRDFEKLTQERQKEILNFYSIATIDTIIRKAKSDAESVIRYADRYDYGYGEVGFNLKEAVKDFAEDVLELEKQYSRLVNVYFDFLTESKDI